ncbi:hypothetical protein [Methylopila sp. 73B]|uniref:hypothetical protein n=1 Tax=Methylopila sp. 73B TaxID=1120792 RepID=UPI0003750E1A|nr:hypothetical protein [Methylopila sp. 73B]
MSEGELRISVGRRPITVVELDLDTCANEYGVAPCAAVLGLTGTQKCFKTFKTCQDPQHFSRTTKTYRFCSAGSLLPIGGDVIYPCITDVDIAATQLNPNGLSVSASVTISMADFPHHDRGVDPYVTERPYQPEAVGTFFGKLRARNPFVINRPMRVNTGYIDDDRVIYTSTRLYFIDRFEGPDANGRFKIIGKDILRFADQEKAEAPKTSQGALSADITNVATSLTLVPAGIGVEYGASGTIRIGDELLTFSGRSGDTLTSLVRGAQGTAAEAHKLNDKVQLAKVYTNRLTVSQILYELLTTYAEIDPAYIPLTDWQAEEGNWLSSLTSTVTLSEPTGVKKLIEEILVSTGSALWWDEKTAKLRFKVLVPVLPAGQVPQLNEADNILEGSLRVKDLEKERISRVIVYFGQISAVKEVQKANLRSVAAVLDAVAEGEVSYGVVSSKEIATRWLSTAAQGTALGMRILSRYGETPREVTFRLDAKDERSTGDLIDLTSRQIQNAMGDPATTRFIITEVRDVEVGTHQEYTALQISQTGGGKAFLIAPNDLPDWSAATSTQKAKYLFVSNNAGAMSALQAGPVIA